MSSGWFETVAEAQRRAKRRLPASVYAALLAGSERGLTVDDNVAAFSELGSRRTSRDCPANVTSRPRGWVSRSPCR